MSAGPDFAWARFRFRKDDIPRVAAAILQEPEIITCDRHVVSSVEAFCLLCRRFAFPVRLLDLVPQFGRPVPTICLIAQHMVQHLDGRFVNLLTSLERPWLSRENLQNMAAAVTSKNAGFQNCWGFVYSTGPEICRPGKDQRIYYNGHKSKHN